MVWSASGSGLTTVELDAALDDTTRNLLRLRKTTISVANQSTTAGSQTKLVTTTIAIQGDSPDVDYSTTFIIAAVNGNFSMVNSGSDFSYAAIKVQDTFPNTSYTGGTESCKTLTVFQYPISGPITPKLDGSAATLDLELWGSIQGGTNTITSISYTYWMYRGA